MRLLLVDGTNAVLRYAAAMIGDLRAESVPDADSLRVLSAVERAIRQCAAIAHCDHAIIAFDAAEGTWRRELFSEYKKGRKKIPFPWSAGLSRFLADGGWFCSVAPGFEADDIIATMARRSIDAGHRVAVLSSDSDLLQLASEWCSIYQYSSGEVRFVLRNPQWIAEHYGIRDVWQLAYYKALVGELGDGLPGVPGIGPKRALHLMAQYPSAKDLSSSRALPAKDLARFRRMLELVTLREDVPLAPLIPMVCRVP